MKGFSHFLTLGWLTAAMTVASQPAGAQGFGLSVTPSSDSILVSNSLTYTINVTNLTGSVFPDIWVTNSFSTPVEYLTATAPPQVGVYTNATSVQFDLGQVSGITPIQMTLTVRPNTTNSLTNAVVLTDTVSNLASTNVVVQVTNVPPARADLGVTMTGPRQPIITNDWMTYSVTVTNAGPDAAANVMLTNIVPSGVIGISLPKQNSGTNSPISLGTLANGGSTNLFFTVEPTNAGAKLFSVSVGSGTLDTNAANNLASTNITVTNYLSGQLVAYTNSTQIPNGQVGYLEQAIVVSNVGPTAVPAVRLVVSGLTNQLANAVGTNGDSPFVVYGSTLDPNRSVNLLLQYSPNRTPFPFSNSQLHPFAVSTPDLSAPQETAVSTNIDLLGIFPMPSGGMLLEFPSIRGRTYTVVYSSDVLFTNAYAAQPSIVAPANYTFWIDYGPPATLSAPTNAPARFYRVYQNP